MITLSEPEKERFLEQCRRDFVKELITNRGDKVYLSLNEAAGILNIQPAKLAKLPIPKRDTTGNGRTLVYRLEDIDAYMDGQIIMGKSKTKRL